MNELGKISRQAGEFNQGLGHGLKGQLKLQADSLNHDLQLIIDKLEKNFTWASELGQKLAAIKESFNQITCDSKDMNQNIRQIKVFFEQIERHLDLKK
jgi:hypothetical protein